MAKGNQRKSFMFGAIAGGIIGSVTALLLAPKAGREIRKDLAEGAQEVGERTVRVASQVSDTTTRIAKQVGSTASNAAGRAKETAGSVIEGVRGWRTSRGDNHAVNSKSDESAEGGEDEQNQSIESKSEELQSIT
ncbi:YtxH domain-containing protein [Paenibacillus sp. sptzw28]|uniref:YtxH domain-containing protein n=1 Tax=Paenibacillus sp. sptzw28 TaxID=715179 RepID=UPI001C6E3C91|nr:YtxH domain-containing protein [Paenibacillus sp. sptzw28]QYR23324.1 YtxH domain-containing protein [Paenibacillus sp. sptzw28]